MDDLSAIHPDLKAAAASVVGSLVSFRFLSGMTLWQRISAVVCGGAMAFFCGSVLAGFFGDAGLTAFIGFLTGLFGIAICDKIYGYISAGLIDDLRARLRG